MPSGKSKYRDISATVWPIGTTFGMMTHIALRTGAAVEIGGRPLSWKIEENVVLMDIINSLLKTGNKTANINVKTAVYTHCLHDFVQ